MAALLIVLVYTPFLQGPIPLGSLGTYVQRFRFNDPFFAAVERVLRPQVAAGLAVCSGMWMAVWLRYRTAGGSPDALAWPIAASL
jgi:hypothetical protein